MDLHTYEKEFFDLLKRVSHYVEAIALMHWDLRTGAPKKGSDDRAESIGQLSADVFQIQTSDRMKELIDILLAHAEELPEDTVKAAELAKKDYDHNKKIPEDEYKEYVILTSKAETAWEDAKAASDFSMFAPYLEKLIDFNKRFISYWGYEDHPYNALLDIFEPGVTVKVLDQLFSELKEAIIPLIKKVTESGNKPDTSFITKTFSKEQQRDLSLYFLKEFGYDFDGGRLDETVHPFATTINRGDVRVTTRYDENDFRTAIFGTIHECGHAIYEQNIDEALSGTNLSDGASMGIHESQSLFYENFIARNQHFWTAYYEKMVEASPDQFQDVKREDLVRAVNEAKPTFIRIEADELTYPLHIIIRYEIEKAIFSNEVTVEELPALWNQKYHDYLGITPPSDAKGILQDVHWAGGDFGYFPSYALGYMYAAQLKHTMLDDLPEFDQLIERGDFEPIKQWLTEKVHQHGRRKMPLDIIKDATGEELNVQYLIEYLVGKYSNLYL
ncbi:carboxypeptidase M32 [Bacillus velezensis]|uniref:carboxypeptidase M32 n=1 Tax=Bacillus TaxID=1386 RepID=UPI001C52D7FC|nr:MULTISPECIES: carboxypeptidase M32 [Bacillus amyloliquefaciens group]QXP95454.1 carboxypeptidase M32 [Bacillus velezensis]UHH01281.1 carboxypeptidase M32 [Bacillus amyloliquefaciens]ULR21029.1 carboxypeptidase M32 [Bacillus velezensis]UVW07772.1 carboxypeptidase M32 [Bacillus velezensis]WHL75078.1 carboxypeptidase M32 [Bacillus velezensis]